MFIIYSKVCGKDFRSVSVIIPEKNVPEEKITTFGETQMYLGYLGL